MNKKTMAVFDGLIDLVVKDNGEVAYLVKHSNEAFEVVDTWSCGDVIFVPPREGNIPWELPRADEVLRYIEYQRAVGVEVARKELLDDLETYFTGISELPDIRLYGFLAAWTMHTYLLEAVNYSPIIVFLAAPERGKTRTGKAMMYVAYRGFCTETLRTAYLVRVARDFGMSIFLDVMDIWDRAGAEFRDALLWRFDKGAIVPRTERPDQGAFGIEYYRLFGPTVIATNRDIHTILDTRAVQINMQLSERVFELDVTPDIGLPLRERLVAFRATHMGHTLPEVASPAKGRLGDILKPILQIILLASPDRENSFRELVEAISAERARERSFGQDALILSTVFSLRDRVGKGMLPVKIITDEYNKGKPDAFRLSYKMVGGTLKSMGLQRVTTTTGAAAYIWDEQKLKRLASENGLCFTTSEDTGGTDDTDVI